MSWTSGADAQVIEVAHFVVEEGMTLTAAIQRAGVQWSGTTFVANATRVLKHLPANSTTARILQRSIEATAAASDVAAGSTVASGAAASGGLIGFISAHPVLFTIGLIAAGLLTAYVARRAGEAFADKPSAVAGPGPVRKANDQEPTSQQQQPVEGEQDVKHKTIQGKWASNWGTIEFDAEGIGTYTHKASILSGKIIDNGMLWEGTWQHTKGDTNSGAAYFRLSEDRDHLSGEYWYGPRKGKSWAASRIE